eukprot:GHVR01036411.1.p1 GENE.GHVR01036411.1~~GHVR01036411.1.p1  ORF type:complete len:108 (-),score=5.03 GHVR01036411.1:282-605(-)
MATRTGVSTRPRNSLISRPIRRLACKWPAIWNNRPVCPSKQIGTTVALDWAILPAVKLRQPGSVGCEKRRAAVLTVAPGKMPMAPPPSRSFNALRRVAKLTAKPSRS